jgi:hypothetical protein
MAELKVTDARGQVVFLTPPVAIDFATPSAPTWLLATGTWNDNGVWKDASAWKD